MLVKRNQLLISQWKMLDKGALNGLRGFLSLHIMLFHALPRPFPNSPPLNLYAAIDMPFFFLLSGFSLAISNGKKSEKGDNQQQTLQNSKNFDYRNFFKNRCIRILPLHYLALIAGFICWKSGYAVLYSSYNIPAEFYFVNRKY